MPTTIKRRRSFVAAFGRDAQPDDFPPLALQWLHS